MVKNGADVTNGSDIGHDPDGYPPPSFFVVSWPNAHQAIVPEFDGLASFHG